jgi:hypothetical protein
MGSAVGNPAARGATAAAAAEVADVPPHVYSSTTIGRHLMSCAVGKYFRRGSHVSCAHFHVSSSHVPLAAATVRTSTGPENELVCQHQLVSASSWPVVKDAELAHMQLNGLHLLSSSHIPAASPGL